MSVFGSKVLVTLGILEAGKAQWVLLVAEIWSLEAAGSRRFCPRTGRRCVTTNEAV